jgi:hypothetical protein
MAAAFRRHIAIVKTVLKAACSLGRVAIVTLAKPGWVDISIQNFLPGVAEILEEYGIEVIYARECLKKFQIRTAALDEMDVFMLMKSAAMRQCIRRLYSSGRSWKNIMSIGDSETERDALSEVTFLHTQVDRKGAEKKCRCKTLKLPEDPDLQQLTAELEVLATWIQPLVLHDGDLAVDLDEIEECMSTFQAVLADAKDNSALSDVDCQSQIPASPRPLVHVGEGS